MSLEIDLLIGGTAGIISRTATAPLELYKIQQQNNYLKNSTMKNVLNKEGFRYLWKGNGTNCIRVFPQFSINYAMYQFSKNNIFSTVKNNNTKNFFSGGLSGIVSMGVIYPLETIRTRLSLQMSHSHYKNIFDAIKKMRFKDNYRGLGMSILGFGPFSALQFTFFHFYKDFFEQYNYNKDIVNLLSGGLSGLSAITFTYPTDLGRRRLQMQGFSNEVPKYSGIFNCFKTIYIEEGIKGLYKGLLPTYIRIFPTLAIQFYCIEKGKDFFKVVGV